MAMSAQQVADYFLASADEEELVTNMKLQKLLYYAQGFHLAVHGEPLFHDPIVAWSHGPVVPEVYHRFKHNGSSGISMEQAPGFDPFASAQNQLNCWTKSGRRMVSFQRGACVK